MPVAVRSSATAEDLPTASFAGQQDTYLNVVGVDALLDAVRRCWASLWTDRAVAYRADNGIDHADGAARRGGPADGRREVAGVLFTANPVTGRRTRAVIDASPGLGEAVVSGAGQPGPLRRRATAGSSSGGSGTRRSRMRALPGGGTERVELRAQQTTGADGPDACITDAQVVALAALGDGSRRTSARRRTSSGPSTTPARSGSPRRGRSPRLYPVPPSPRRRAARRTSASAWPRG